MPPKQVLRYGSWPSRISVDMAVGGSLRLAEAHIDGASVYWIEGRPQERGRQVIVRWDEQHGARDVTPADFAARTMAHEYGGGAWTVHEGTVWFANLSDGRLYVQPSDQPPTAISAAGPFRYGDLTWDAAHNRLLAVREDHTNMHAEAEDTLVALHPSTQAVTVLARGYDFYSSPRLSPNGRQLAWLSWRHPNMPWDGTELWLADVSADGRLSNEHLIAGGSDESVLQPEWTADGRLVFVSDRSGWWNLYLADVDGGGTAQPIWPTEAELAGPQWAFGMSWYAIDEGRIVAVARRNGRDELWRIPLGDDAPRRIDVPDEQINGVRVGNGRVVYVGASSREPAGVVLLERDGTRRVLRRAFEPAVSAEHFSQPEMIDFPTSGGQIAHALYYPPTNPDCTGPTSERPPLVVTSHGGPTATAGRSLDLGKQLFTSRGFALVDVDYGGSSGYGRDYMRRLDGEWGRVDVDDCIAAAQFLAQRGDVDPKRLLIRGSSASAFTTLSALVFHDVFAAGASHYGIGDLGALARDTHKFESRYITRLVAPYPERMDIYRERSPIEHIERLAVPVIVLQGADDRVVPPAQAEQIVGALRERRIPHAYLLFEGEGHGFRQAEHIRRALEAELSFYAQVLGFELADSFVPVEVQFLGSATARV